MRLRGKKYLTSCTALCSSLGMKYERSYETIFEENECFEVCDILPFMPRESSRNELPISSTFIFFPSNTLLQCDIFIHSMFANDRNCSFVKNISKNFSLSKIELFIRLDRLIGTLEEKLDR